LPLLPCENTVRSQNFMNQQVGPNLTFNLLSLSSWRLLRLKTVGHTFLLISHPVIAA
jgi:hypothetical protein